MNFREREIKRLMAKEPQNEGRNIILSILLIMASPWLMFWIALNGDVIDAFIMAHRPETGIALIVLSFIGIIKFTKLTIEKRCEKAVELTQPHKTSVYWCNLNNEGDLLQEMDKSAYQIHGSMDLDKKEELLLGFFKGEIQRLITKPKMTAFGLNWQHCNHTVYFPTFSYEQYYQAIRRFWRFGQKKEVIVDLVFSDGQRRILDSLLAKTEKANQLFDKLNANINQKFEVKTKEFNKPITLPAWTR